MSLRRLQPPQNLCVMGGITPRNIEPRPERKLMAVANGGIQFTYTGQFSPQASSSRSLSEEIKPAVRSSSVKGIRSMKRSTSFLSRQ